MTKNTKTGLPEKMYLWLVTVSFAMSVLVCVSALRNNNQRMVELREEVYAADKAGEGVEDAIKALREHIYAHMNTSLTSSSNGIRPPLQLKYTYERLLAAEQAKVEQAGSSVYTDAQEYCQAQNSTDFSGRNRVPCVQEYVATHNPDAVANIPASLYQFDFVSPAWSPDLAGWSLATSVVFGLVAVLMLVARYLAGRRPD